MEVLGSGRSSLDEMATNNHDSLSRQKEIFSEVLLEEFRQLLTGDVNRIMPSKESHRPWITVHALGVFALGLDYTGDECECVAFGSVRKELFPEIMWERILQAQSTDDSLRPYAVAQDKVILELKGVIFSLRYFECKELVYA
jgi:hypothetical protein